MLVWLEMDKSARHRSLIEAARHAHCTHAPSKDSPTDGSWKTINRLVSSSHLILNPPFPPSQSAKALWMSFVFNSFGNPLRKRIRVTEAERPARLDMDASYGIN